MQNTVGKLMECIVARKLARDLEDSDILPANRGGGWGGGERESSDKETCTKDSRGKKQQ